MRRGAGIPLILVCAGLNFCGERQLDCGTDEVIGALSSMVRDRVLRVAADAYPPSFDAAKRTALTKAIRVTPRDAKLVEWDTAAGRLACVARVVIDAPGPERDTNRRRETVLGYRVTRNNDVFFVEIAYTDLLNLFPSRANSLPDARSAPAMLAVRPPG